MPNLATRIAEGIARFRNPTRSLLAALKPEDFEARVIARAASVGPEIVVPPISQEPPQQARVIARAPVIDRFPIVIGQSLNGQYLSSAYRLCTTGWRYQFVDLINELLEFDPDARGPVRQRILAVAGGRVEIHPAKLRADDPRADLAKKIAEDFSEDFENLPARTQSLGQLQWGVIYGLSAAEIEWDQQDGWVPVSLSNIHSRRLNYPNPSDWELYIYDQGMVGPGFGYMGPTTGMYGLRVSSVPGKFIVHAPALNADYPTRDGEARYIGMYLLLKRMVVRASAQDFERTIRPWIVGYFNRDLNGSDGDMPIATPEDEAALATAINALGMGSLNSATLPNTVKIEILRAASQMNAAEFISFLNRAIAKALLGQAFTTEPGPNGNLATATVAKEVTKEISRYDARCMADTLERDLALPWMQLNYPAVPRRLLPRITIMVDDLPDPEKVTNVAAKMTSIDAPVDLDKLSELNGIPLVPKDDKEARRSRMVVGGKGVTPQAGEDPNEGGGPLDQEDDKSGDDGNAADPNRANAKPNGKSKAKPQVDN